MFFPVAVGGLNRFWIAGCAFIYNDSALGSQNGQKSAMSPVVRCFRVVQLWPLKTPRSQMINSCSMSGFRWAKEK